ncbi:MAG: DUF393 domain-containing protein [Gammaproteobacteria bacterium]
MGEDTRPVVFYDGGCPLCRREIAHYRGLAGARNLQWLDIHREPERLSDFGLTPEQAMASFHVLDAQNRWQRGAAGFIELWSHLPGYRRLAALVRGLRLAGPLQALYRPWAAWRLRRRCHRGACERPRDHGGAVRALSQ